MASDDAGIRALMAEWRRASHAGDVEALLAMLDEDVVFLTPGNPPMGRKEFEAGFRRFSAKATVDAVAGAGASRATRTSCRRRATPTRSSRAPRSRRSS